MATKTNGMVILNGVSNDGAAHLDLSLPYVAHVRIQGSTDILFHRWSSDEVEAKATSAKNSKAKKSDNLESYVYRTPDGNLAIPGEYPRMALITAAKFRQDPRSPRKSAMDLYKAGVVSLTPLADLGVQAWDYEDRRRAVVQRSGITRTRPAMHLGYEASFAFQVLLPEYITPTDLHAVISDAGRLVGIGDFRPTYGRFQVIEYRIDMA